MLANRVFYQAMVVYLYRRKINNQRFQWHTCDLLLSHCSGGEGRGGEGEERSNVQSKEISIRAHRGSKEVPRVRGGGVGGGGKIKKKFKETYGAKFQFLEGWGCKPTQTLWTVGVWIFSRTQHLLKTIHWASDSQEGTIVGSEYWNTTEKINSASQEK